MLRKSDLVLWPRWTPDATIIFFICNVFFLYLLCNLFYYCYFWIAPAFLQPNVLSIRVNLNNIGVHAYGIEKKMKTVSPPLRIFKNHKQLKWRKRVTESSVS